MCSVVSGASLRGHIELGLKDETKKLVVDIIPRYEFGCYLSKTQLILFFGGPRG